MIHTETDFLTLFGERLAKLREDSGKSVDEVAEIAGVKRRQWYRWEKGEHSVPLYAMYRIVRTLNLSADELLPR